MVNTGILIHLISTFIVTWLCIFPILIIWIRRIYKVRKSVLMRKRHIDASLLCCIFLLIWMYLNRPLGITKGYLYINGYEQYPSFFIFNCIQSMIYPYCAHGGVYAVLYRFWMIYFEFIYSESLENQQWKAQINPKGCSKQELWIIRHRKDYGNSKWISLRLVIVYIIVASFSATLRLLTVLISFDPNTASSIDSALYLLPLISVFILWYKMPAFKDTFLVKDELKWIVIVYAIGLLTNISGVTFFRLNPDINMYWNESIWMVLVFIVLPPMVFVQTQYIFYRIRNDAVYFRNILSTHMYKMYDESHTEYSMESKSGINVQQHVVASVSHHEMSSKHKLCDILSNKGTLHLFMHHISTEFSTECMFSFIEFTQFRTFLETDADFMSKVRRYTMKTETDEQKTYAAPQKKKKKKRGKDCYEDVVLLDAETIPLSYIIYDQEYGDVITNVDRYRCIVIALAEKYLYDSGAFCININYKTRHRVMEWIGVYCIDKSTDFELKQFYQMYRLFEKCREEMYKLMRYSFSRFVKTEQFLSFDKHSE